MDCASAYPLQAAARRVFEALSELERVRDVREITAHLELIDETI